MTHDVLHWLFLNTKMQYTRYFAISLIEIDTYIYIYIFKMLQLAANAT